MDGSLSTISAIISKIDQHKLYEVDGILEIVLKECAPELAIVLFTVDILLFLAFQIVGNPLL